MKTIRHVETIDNAYGRPGLIRPVTRRPQRCTYTVADIDPGYRGPRAKISQGALNRQRTADAQSIRKINEANSKFWADHAIGATQTYGSERRPRTTAAAINRVNREFWAKRP